MKLFWIGTLLAALLAASCSRDSPTKPEPRHQQVILKADDLRFIDGWTVSHGWMRFLLYVETKEIPVAIGVIGDELERSDSTYKDLVRSLQASGLIEFFNHGYDHAVAQTDSATGRVYSEFRGTTYEHQKDHLERTQRLMREECGITMRTFGAPGNAFDWNTTRVIDESEEIDIWLYGDPASHETVLSYSLRIEDPIFVPAYDQFVASYDPSAEYLVLQIHPKDWTDERFVEFIRVVDFLLVQGVEFTTPSAMKEMR